ncbi:hypothetical protein [Pseudoduganella sp.]|uniref:hypothetical protein n=1 Tax=Pseudoduganella sp. TaxID=1880898 RepID=UPI0035AEAF25
MNIRRFLVILLLMLLPVQVTLAAADSCCLAAKVTQAAEHAVAADADADAGDDASCCTSCDFCHHSHAPFVAVLDEASPQATSIAPAQPPEPTIHSFIPDLPPRPNWLL